MKLSDNEILAKIQAAENASYGSDSELTSQRAEALDYYLGKPFGNEVGGRSQVVSTDVADVIESLMPQLMKIFASGDEVVKFNPRGPDDIDAADQETEVINYLVMEKGAGFSTLYTWFKDALLMKNAYVKVFYEDKEDIETEVYNGLTDDEFAMLGTDPEVEIVEHTSYPDEIDAQQRAQAMQQMMLAAQNGDQNAIQAMQQLQNQPPAMLHDVKVQTKAQRGEICIKPIAPENIRVSTSNSTVSLQEADFVQHAERMTVAEAKEQGYDVSDIGGSEYDESEEANARDLYGEEDDYLNRKVWVKDTYIRIDGELKRYVVVGSEIVDRDEDCEIIPFACITPIIMPHRHIGRSIADLVMDIQLIKSTLMRGQLDNIYLANSPRFGVSERVNLDDMLVSRPGGVVRVQGDPGGAIMPLISPPLPPQSFSMIEYIDGVREQRTGATRYNQGLDANSLNKTASGIQQIMSAAQERVLLVARIFAETGVKELFMLAHRLMKKYSQRPMVMRLRNEWVNVDPRTWKTRYDMSISVGLGTGNKDQQMMHITTILQAQKEALALGIATPQTIYNALSKLTINAGFKNPEEFWVEPQGQMPQQPNPLVEVEKIKQEGKQREMQISTQMDIQKFQAQTQIEQQRSQNDVAIETAKIEKQMELARYEAELNAATALQKAQMELEAKKQIALMEAEIDANMAMRQHASELGGLVEKARGAQGDQSTAAIIQGVQAMIQSMNAPKQVVRGEDGSVVGIQAVQ